MVDWEQWETLLAVFRGGTFAQAAKTLRVDATTVGRRLKLLERRVGYALFVREDGRLYPTNRCEQLLPHIEAASEALRAAENQTATPAGAIWRHLRLTAPPFLITHLLATDVSDLSQSHRIKIELMGASTNVSLSRREADIAVRIDDRPPALKADPDQVRSQSLGSVAYAVYVKQGVDPHTLPWAGLMEEHVRTSGGETMMRLAGTQGFQFRAYLFDSLREIAAAGVARTMLPCFVADRDERLQRVSTTVLEQPLWMLYHRQDDDVPHLKAARQWIKSLARKHLSTDPVAAQTAIQT